MPAESLSLLGPFLRVNIQKNVANFETALATKFYQYKKPRFVVPLGGVFPYEPPVVVPDVGQVVGEAQVEEVRLLVHIRAVPANIRSRDHDDDDDDKQACGKPTRGVCTRLCG